MGRNEVKPEQALYGAFEVKHKFYITLYFLRSSFFVRLGIPFLRPDPHVLRPTRTRPVKVGRRSSLAPRSVVSSPRLVSALSSQALFRCVFHFLHPSFFIGLG